MQSANGGWGAFDADNTDHYLNHIPFADHGALLDPPTVDVTAPAPGARELGREIVGQAARGFAMPRERSRSKKRRFFTASIGSMIDWLPSRRSVLSQTGACVRTTSGQVRSVKPIGWKGRYLLAGCINMLALGCKTSNPNENGPLLAMLTGRGIWLTRALPSPPVGD